MKLRLAIDRSYNQGSWALYKGHEALESAAFIEDKPRSPTWFPAIINALAARNLSPSDIEEYIVGTGPGSFSGIRAVIAALQGLALPTKIPVLGIQSAAAIAVAEAVKGTSKRIIVVGDARRGELWIKSFDSATETDKEIAQEPILTTIAELEGFVTADTLITSPDIARLSKALHDVADKRGATLKEEAATCTADDIMAAYLKYPAAAVRDPLPVYLHPAVM